MARIVVGPRCEYNNFLESKSPATAGSHALARIVNLRAYPARACTPVAHVRRFWADVRVFVSTSKSGFLKYSDLRY
jgi:hypothetical protein